MIFLSGLLTLPLITVAGAVYCFLAVLIYEKEGLLSRILQTASFFFVVTFLLEIGLLGFFGVNRLVQDRGLFGAMFSFTHLYNLLFGPPAVANLLVLSDKSSAAGRAGKVIGGTFLFLIAAGIMCLFTIAITEADGPETDEERYGLDSTASFLAHFDKQAQAGRRVENRIS